MEGKQEKPEKDKKKEHPMKEEKRAKHIKGWKRKREARSEQLVKHENLEQEENPETTEELENQETSENGEQKEKESKKSIFRKEALEAMSTKQKLEESVVVINPKSWIALFTSVVLVILGFLWAIFGRIPERVEGMGMLLKASGNFILYTEYEAEVEKVFVQEGDLVQEDQVLVKMTNKKIVLDIQSLEEKKARIEDFAAAFKALETEKIDVKRIALEESIDKGKQETVRLEKELQAMQRDYYWKEKLYEEGLISLPTLNSVVQNINEKMSQIDNAKISILQNQASLKDLPQLLQFQEFETQKKEVEAAIAQKKLDLDYLIVKSPYKGKILSVSVKEGQEVKLGQNIIWGEQHIPNENDMLFYGFFTSPKNQRLKEGMLGEVTLRDVDDKLYGQLMVSAKEVWPFPLAADALYKIIGNDQIVSLLTDGGRESPIQATFQPFIDKTTVSGFKWTSKKGPPFEISSGVLGDIRVTISSQRPISYLFPFLRELRESTNLSKIEEMSQTGQKKE
jgi:HlyD family secretion protein